MSNDLTKSARRVFEILELFRERQCPLRLKDVVDALGMPTSSAAALLKTMAQMNYLSFESASRAYLPTLRISQLGSWVTIGQLRERPDPGSGARIGRKVGETILLGTVTDIYVEIVEILRARQPLQYYTMVGPRSCWSIRAWVGRCSRPSRQGDRANLSPHRAPEEDRSVRCHR